MVFIGLTQQQVKQLENEDISQRAVLQLTRLLRKSVDSHDANVHIVRTNNVLNICRHVLGLSTIIIRAYENDYHFADSGWIYSEFAGVLRQADMAELVEMLADLIQEGWIKESEVNAILSSNGCGIYFETHLDKVTVYIPPVELIDDELEDEIPNIRILLGRMEAALSNADYPGVLHASASILETLAKDTLTSPSIQNQTLAGFFDKYRNSSNLPAPILDYILDIYRRRNTEPIAGHGGTAPPTITENEAVVIFEMTKAFLHIERKLSSVHFSLLSSSPHTTH